MRARTPAYMRKHVCRGSRACVGIPRGVHTTVCTHHGVYTPRCIAGCVQGSVSGRGRDPGVSGSSMGSDTGLGPCFGPCLISDYYGFRGYEQVINRGIRS